MIILWGKKGCEMCDKAKAKLCYVERSYEFKEIPNFEDSTKFVVPDNWRETNLVDLAAAYSFYWPMPLPLFQFEDGQILGYADGLARVMQEERAKKVQVIAIQEEKLAVA